MSIKKSPMPLSSALVLWIRNASIMIVAWKPSTRWIWFHVSPSTFSGSLTCGANATSATCAAMMIPMSAGIVAIRKKWLLHAL